MKIRIMGTKEELALAKQYYEALEYEKGIKSVEISTLYPNRGSKTIFRLYVTVEYFDEYFRHLDYFANKFRSGEFAVERRNA